MKTMETNTAAMYLRKSTEDDGKSVAQQERELREVGDVLLGPHFVEGLADLPEGLLGGGVAVIH